MIGSAANPRLGVNLSAGTLLAPSGSVLFSNANGVSFGMQTSAGGSYIVTASIAGAAITAISAGATNVTSGTLSFGNANGVSFGLDGQTMTAQLPQLSYWNNRLWAAQGLNQEAWDCGNAWFQRLRLDLGIAATQARMLRINNDSGSAFTLGTWSITPGEYLYAVGGNTMGCTIGIYTMTGSTANLASSATGARYVTTDAGAGSTNGFYGVSLASPKLPGGGALAQFFAAGWYSMGDATSGATSLPASVVVSQIIQSNANQRSAATATQAFDQGMPIPYVEFQGTF